MNDARRLTIRRLLAATAFFSVSGACFSALPAAVSSNLIALPYVAMIGLLFSIYGGIGALVGPTLRGAIYADMSGAILGGLLFLVIGVWIAH